MTEKMAAPSRAQMEKLEQVKGDFAEMGEAAVAFSGGVDSTFLLRVAKEALGERVIALTAVSDFFPQRELKEAQEFCEREQIRHILCPIRELEIPHVAENPKDRCYFCKRALFEMFLSTAKEQGIRAVAEGSNLDDLGDYRPGLRAVAELQIHSPLRACGLTKQDIRVLSAYLGLPTAEKPSYACLASRLPYGERITKEKLAMVERGEQLLFDLGFRQMRVRLHDNAARIEVLPEDFGRMIDGEVRRNILETFRELGFSYVSMDLAGYRTGSMNEGIEETMR